MAGNQIGVNVGGIKNDGYATCPEDVTQPWEYWYEFFEVRKRRGQYLVVGHTAIDKL